MERSRGGEESWRGVVGSRLEIEARDSVRAGGREREEMRYAGAGEESEEEEQVRGQVALNLGDLD